MGIERSYKAFFGIEISISGRLFNSRACISISSEQYSECNGRASGSRNTFQRRMQTSQNHRETITSKSPHNMIQEAEFEIVSEESGLSEKRNIDIQKSPIEPELIAISNNIKTYLNGRDHLIKGCRFDFRV